MRERRDVGARHRTRDAHSCPRFHVVVHDHTALGRTAVGGQLRLQQRRRGGAALRLAHQRPVARGRVVQRQGDDARRLRRVLVRQPRRHARLGQPVADRRDDQRAERGPHGAVAVEHRADGQHRRLREIRAAHAGHRVVLLRDTEQRRAAAALHHQPDAAATCAAAGARPAAKPRSSPPTSASCRARRRTGGSARASGTTASTTTRRARTFRSSSTTTRRSRRRRPADPSRSRTAGPTSRPTRPGRGCRRWR